jgi:transposase
MRGYSEDLRQRIVSSVEGGMSKAQAARTFSVEPLLGQALRGRRQQGREPPAPKKSPGSTTKLADRAIKLSEEDLDEERPFATLRDRCGYMEVMTGLSVSRSTMCRAIARIGPTRKKGDE